MADVCENTKPISVEEFFNTVKKNVHATKGYYSLYITPKGDIIDCRYPASLDHNNFSAYVYNNLSLLPEDIYNSCLRGLDIPFEETAYYIEDYHNLFDISYVDSDLFTKIDKVLLGTEDRICQDLGFVKVAINTKLKTNQVVVPCSIFGKRVTAHQKETIEKLSEEFNMDIDLKLNSEQRGISSLASKIQSALSRVTTGV